MTEFEMVKNPNTEIKMGFSEIWLNLFSQSRAGRDLTILKTAEKPILIWRIL